MNLVAKSDMTTGNKKYASYAVQSGEMVFVFTAPYSSKIDVSGSCEPHPNFTHQAINEFIVEHGLAVRAIVITSADAEDAYHTAVKNGAVGVLEPTKLVDRKTGKYTMMSEIRMYKDQTNVVLRFVSGDYDGVVLPNYEPVTPPHDNSYGLQRVDHMVSNVPKLFDQIDYLMAATGFHEFSEFTAEDVGTVDSGLNSMVLANNNEYVLLPINEPTHGTRRKSQIQNYLEHNNGSGVQHIAVKTEDIFATMREMKKRTDFGGFDFMPAPGPEYYANIPNRIGPEITQDQIKQLQELGLLADRDEQGILLQVFTKPIGDRPTIFMEIIQRLGCDKDHAGEKIEQTAGCGGFGKGNFSELFKSIENFEKSQEVVV
jgi:4-hydroxyphenylpyruvate dioxygenase